MKAHEADGSLSVQPHETFDSPFYERFRRLVAWCLHRRYLTIGITFGTFALGLVGMVIETSGRGARRRRRRG